MPRWKGWAGFVAWALAGALLAFSYLAGFSIGLFVLPFALLAVLFVAWRAPGWAEAVGVVAGVGAVCLLIAFLSRDYNPCPESGVLTVPVGETSAECGGQDPMPWLAAGIVLVGVSVAAHAFIQRWDNTRPRVGAAD